MSREGVQREGSVQAKLQQHLVEFGSLTRKLLEATGKPNPDVTTEILQKLTARDKEIQKLAAVAMEMCTRQQELTHVQEELEQRKQQVLQLQSNLQEAERIIELAVYKGRQKLEAIEQAEEGAVSPEDLIRYAHRISQSSSVVSPVGWQINDSRRPFPHDIEMRRGVLGQLSSGLKPRPPEVSNAGSTSGTDISMPPEKKFAVAGMNQNLNNCEAGAQLGLVEAVPKPAQPLPVPKEPEIMSEDSSASSDEGS